MDKTIIYYTCNREEEGFEEKIKKKLLEAHGDIPIISVSHKPIDLGKNIYVGVHQPSNVLLFHQLLLGCKKAKTPFVINAEADFLYPPDYFNFEPPEKNKIYRFRNIRLMYKYHWGFFRKSYSEGAQIAGREYLISVLENALKGIPLRPQPYDHSKYRKFNPYSNVPFEMFGGELACLTFKTGDSLHKFTAVERSQSLPELPYWGTAKNMRREIFNI